MKLSCTPFCFTSPLQRMSFHNFANINIVKRYSEALHPHPFVDAKWQICLGVAAEEYFVAKDSYGQQVTNLLHVYFIHSLKNIIWFIRFLVHNKI